MTKQDYERIARAITSATGAVATITHAHGPVSSIRTLHIVAQHLADELAHNPRFDRARFLDACSMPQEDR
jgi:hypothetical protein